MWSIVYVTFISIGTAGGFAVMVSTNDIGWEGPIVGGGIGFIVTLILRLCQKDAPKNHITE